MINKDKTLKKYKYHPDDLAETSTKKIIWNCDSCNLERTYPYYYFVKKYKKSLREDGNELCQKCAHSHRKNSNEKKNNKSEIQQLPKEVDYEKTLSLFGTDINKLGPWSRQRVFIKCSCGKESTPKRCNLNSLKSIKETGNYKCNGCWTKERRKGLKLSEETKNKMKKSQQRRRKKNTI